MIEFYDAIEEANPNDLNVAMTVLSGEAFGEKALVCGHKLAWKSKENGFFAAHRETIEKIKDSGSFIVDGRKLFCEVLGREKKLVICGGGHVSIPVIEMGRRLGFQVTVLEDRPKFANHARCAGAMRVFCESFEVGLDKIEGDEDTYFVIVTRGHRFDQICLEQIVKKRHAYIGMMGSRKRVKLVKEAVAAKGGNPEVLGRVYTPIGLSIGAETPEEIAVAILAEIIEVKNRKKRSSGYSRELMQALRGGEPGTVEAGQKNKVLATIVERRGSAPRQVGTKMLILSDGQCIGTIGGGCAEADVVRRALSRLQSGSKAPELYRVDMTTDAAEEEGMVCGGVIDVLLEVIETE